MQDAGNGALAGRTQGLEANDAVAGNHARKHLVATLDDAWHAFARERSGVKGSRFAHEVSIDWDTLAGFDLDDIAHLDVGGIDGLVFAVTHHHRMVRAEGYQRLDIASCTADGAVLQRLTDAV